MANAHEELFRKLYYRANGQGRRLCKCRKCDAGPISIAVGFDLSERCDECESVDWRDLTEEEFVTETTLMSDFLALTLHSDQLASGLATLYEVEPKSKEWIKALRKLVQGLEGFGDAQTARWLQANFEKHPQIIQYVLDEFYTRDFLKKARKMVDRTMKLSAMIPTATPDPGVNLYLREATRCYIAGFWESSVALSRATLEFALKDRLKSEQGLPPTDDKLKTVIEFAYLRRLIDHAHRDMAEDVRKSGNDVVHGSTASDDLAERVLCNTRGVLDYLYSR